jgi:HlyD family secretion protein
MLLAVAGFGAGGYYLWKNAPAREGGPAGMERPKTARIEARDIRFAVSAAGDIGPADQVSVRPEVNGRIAQLPVDIGDKVRRGALLCQLDDQDLQIERSSRVAEREGARLQLLRASRNFERNRKLFAGSLVSQEVYDDSKTELDLATNSVDRSEQSLRLVEDHISKTKIMAPFDCTVLTRPVSLGQTVSGAAGFNAGTEVMSIANLSEMVVNAHINQADVARLQSGQKVDIQVEAVPGLTMSGVIDRIAPQAVIKNSVKGFAARINLLQIDPRVRPGMTAILSIPVSAAENVLAVPLAAVFTEPNGDRYVFVQDEDRFERRAVIIGATDYAYAEVREGLESGDVVSLEQTVTGIRQGADGFAPRPGNGRKSGAERSPARGGQQAESAPRTPSRPAGSGS